MSELGQLYASGYTVIEQKSHDHLRKHYFSPLSGMRAIAAGLLDEWGHDSADHWDLLNLMEVELSGALVETAADLMRDAGLRDLRVEPATAP
ncbi:hypothetical protein [Streptomyces sp. PA03-2a]|uniref:hypothetical protein n=1 Tax=Streptomyces sp. PA03-2a TaxID=3028701 RepID=UPI0029AABC3C|nr:hypothetical protein [Streptomyces sp. PA03-2a]MDX2732842.1 hypothetical protein [Streptomyces sp. PA03-2a]